MYKIEFREISGSNPIVKSRKYESKEAFEKWWDRHVKRLGKSYNMRGLILQGGPAPFTEWKEVRVHWAPK